MDNKAALVGILEEALPVKHMDKTILEFKQLAARPHGFDHERRRFLETSPLAVAAAIAGMSGITFKRAKADAPTPTTDTGTSSPIQNQTE